MIAAVCPAPLSPKFSVVGKHVLLGVVGISCFYGVNFPGCWSAWDWLIQFSSHHSEETGTRSPGLHLRLREVENLRSHVIGGSVVGGSVVGGSVES